MSEKMQERLERVHKDIIFLANEVEDALFKAVKALKKQDMDLAKKVKEDDWKINQQEVNIEKQILEILALQQPVAVDLRFLIVALKMNNDLERTADHAKSIAKIAMKIADEPLMKPFDHIERLGKITRRMLHDAVQAFIHRDSDLAREVLERDQEVDDLYDKITEEIFKLLEEKHDKIRQGYEIINTAKHLERAADLATNLSEDVVFMNDAEIIRYGMNELE
jgi:phosphate transport system protein